MQIDHVELFVPDPYQGADWGRILGLRIGKEFEHQAANPSGPLVVATPAGVSTLALFQGSQQQSQPIAGFHRAVSVPDGNFGDRLFLTPSI